MPVTDPVGELCEFCGVTTNLLNFNAAVFVLNPTRLIIVSGTICFTCWAKVFDDAALAAVLLKRRADAPILEE